MTTKTATCLIPVLPDWRSAAGLYRFDPPLRDDDDREVPLAVISATELYGDVETFIFASNERGEVSDWRELSGSQRGVYSAAAVLAELGYSVR